MTPFLTIWLSISVVLGILLSLWFEYLCFGEILPLKEEIFKALPIIILCFIAWPVLIIILPIWHVYKVNKNTTSIERRSNIKSGNAKSVSDSFDKLSITGLESLKNMNGIISEWLQQKGREGAKNEWIFKMRNFERRTFPNKGNRRQTLEAYGNAGLSRNNMIDLSGQYLVYLVMHVRSFKYVLNLSSNQISKDEKSEIRKLVSDALNIFEINGIEIDWNSKKMPIITKYKGWDTIIDPN